GKVAYVLDQSVLKSGVLLVVDVDCNQELEDEQIPMPINDPTHFVVSPDGKRAYVTDGRVVQVVNLEGGHAIVNPVTVVGPPDLRVRRLALSADGRRLYMASLNGISPAGNNRIRVFETATLEQVAEGKATLPSQQPRESRARVEQTQSPFDIA